MSLEVSPRKEPGRAGSGGAAHPAVTLVIPILFALVFLGLLLRIGLTLWYVDLGDPELWEFGVIAKNLAETGVFSFNNPGVHTALTPPGFPMVIALFYRLFGVTRAAHFGVAALLWIGEIVTPLLLGWLVSLVWDRKAGLIALAIGMFWPMFLIMSGRLHSIGIYMPLLVLACAIMFCGRVSLLKRGVLVGLVLGVYVWFRSDGIAYAIPFLYYVFREKGVVPVRLAGRVAVGAAMLGSLLLVVSPWLVRNYVVFRELVTNTMHGYSFLIGHHAMASGTTRPPWNPADSNRYDLMNNVRVPTSEIPSARVYQTPQDELNGDRFNYRKGLEFIVSHPQDDLKIALYKAYYFLVADFTHPIGRNPIVWAPSFLAMVLGLYAFARQGLHDPRQQTLWLLFLLQFGIVVSVFHCVRFRLVVDFIPVAFLSAYLVSFADILLRTPARRTNRVK